MVCYTDPYERIVIAGKGYVSTDAIQLLTDHNINVILLDSFTPCL
jgi:CRISP-associated protein Cas1